MSADSQNLGPSESLSAESCPLSPGRSPGAPVRQGCSLSPWGALFWCTQGCRGAHVGPGAQPETPIPIPQGPPTPSPAPAPAGGPSAQQGAFPSLRNQPVPPPCPGAPGELQAPGCVHKHPTSRGMCSTRLWACPVLLTPTCRAPSSVVCVSPHPRAAWDPKAVPGRDSVVCTAAGHACLPANPGSRLHDRPPSWGEPRPRQEGWVPSPAAASRVPRPSKRQAGARL